MGLSKNTVYEFLSKVQQKAIDTIDEKYKVLTEKAIDEYLGLPENVALTTAIDDLQAALDLAKQKTKNLNVLANRNLSCTHYDVRGELFYGWYALKVESIRDIKSKRDNEIQPLKIEYSKIRAVCQKKKTGEKGMEFLKSIGFDVSWLEKHQPEITQKPAPGKINTKILFPCKEKGLKTEEVTK